MSQQMQNKLRKPRAKRRRWTIEDHMRVQTRWRYKMAGVRYDKANGESFFDLETGAELSEEEANKRWVEYWRRNSGRELTFDQLLDRMLKFY